MDLSTLNPQVVNACVYEKATKTEEKALDHARLFYLISGELTVRTGSEKRRLSPGNLLFLPAGTVYSAKSKYLRLGVVSFDFCEEGAGACEIPAFSAPLFLDEIEGEEETFTRLAELFVSAEGNYLAEASAITKSLLLHIAEATNPNALPSRMIRALDEYIRDNFTEDLSNTEIGAIFGYHPFYISRVLKERRGMTLKQYIIAYRMKVARSYLENTDKSVNDIAEELGFSDSSYFTKSFKAAYGVTPKEYRTAHENDVL